jgi:hypothetical protein
MNENIKTRALKYVFDNIYCKRIFPQKSFNEFRKENMYFICHLSVKEQMREFEIFKFYENCRQLKLPLLKGDIQQFMLDQEGTKKGTTND